MTIEQETDLMYKLEQKKIVIEMAINDLKFLKEYIKEEAILTYIDRRIEALTQETKGEK